MVFGNPAAFDLTAKGTALRLFVGAFKPENLRLIRGQRETDSHTVLLSLYPVAACKRRRAASLPFVLGTSQDHPAESRQHAGRGGRKNRLFGSCQAREFLSASESRPDSDYRRPRRPHGPGF